MNDAISTLLTVSCIAASALVACGGEDASIMPPATTDDGAGGAATPEEEPQGDVVGPTITSTVPADGAAAIEEGQLIVLRFSEPMNTASVEAAYISERLPRDAVEFTWNAAGDTANIVPNAYLEYAMGDETVEALDYEITVGVEATDVAGNPLEEPVTFGFDTLRRIVLEIPATQAMTGSVLSNGLANDEIVSVGDQQIVNVKSDVRGLVTFDLSLVPEGIEAESINFNAAQASVAGDPSSLGALFLESVFYDALDQWAYSAEPQAGHQLASNGAEIPIWNADVRQTVEDDLMNRAVRNNQCQYRLRFAVNNNDNGAFDKLYLEPASIELELVYLAE